MFAEAAKLGARRPQAKPLPPLFFVTDPRRTPDPAAIVRGLPRGAGVIYRSFGDPNAVQIAAGLKRVCAARGLVLSGWVANSVDPDLLNATATVEAIAARIDAPLLGWVPRLEATGPELIAAALEHLDFSHLPLGLGPVPATHPSSAKEI